MSENEEVPVGDDITDGYHTFGELYQHRAVLFIALMKLKPGISWYSPCHEDESAIPGFFIAGMQLPTGQVSYHMHIDPWWQLLQDGAHVPCYLRAPKWDGHTPQVGLDRVIKWIEAM